MSAEAKVRGRVRVDVGGLIVTDLEAPSTATEPALDSLSFGVDPGEIVGVAGVENNGQRSLVSVLAGLTRATAGTIRLAGTDIAKWHAKARRGHGVRVIPFDRNSEGVSLSSPVWQNFAIRDIVSGRCWLLSPRRLRRECQASVTRWQVKCGDIDALTGNLSGGNIQRLILAREFAPGARMIVAAQPTRGLDIGATRFVHESMRAMSRERVPVLLVSSDLDELFALSDRLLVMLGGSLVANCAPPYSLGMVGAAMTGALT